MVAVATTDEIRQRAIDRFWETIPPVWNRVKSNLRSIASENHEISVEQFHILRHIRRGINSVSELAEVKQISRSAISQAIEILVDKGLISRQQNAGDRRFVRLALTPAGDTLLSKIFQENRSWMVEKMATLEPQELDAIIAGLEALKVIFEYEPHP
jgi:DNA-binding MarR family transcriptional regulator